MFLENAFELLAGLIDGGRGDASGSAEKMAEHVKETGRADLRPLSADEKELAAAIVVRWGVSPEAAADLVRWLRTAGS